MKAAGPARGFFFECQKPEMEKKVEGSLGSSGRMV
jgi:hypothetical protein